MYIGGYRGGGGLSVPGVETPLLWSENVTKKVTFAIFSDAAPSIWTKWWNNK